MSATGASSFNCVGYWPFSDRLRFVDTQTSQNEARRAATIFASREVRVSALWDFTYTYGG